MRASQGRPLKTVLFKRKADTLERTARRNEVNSWGRTTPPAKNWAKNGKKVDFFFSSLPQIACHQPCNPRVCPARVAMRGSGNNGRGHCGMGANKQDTRTPPWLEVGEIRTDMSKAPMRSNPPHLHKFHSPPPSDRACLRCRACCAERLPWPRDENTTTWGDQAYSVNQPGWCLLETMES